MSEQSTLAEADDRELAELVAEIAERLRQGEKVLPEDYPRNAETLRELLPTIKMVADLPTAASVSPDLGRLDDFRLLREVGRGGMGIVYEAVQVSLGRRVALKVLPNASALDPRHLQRFHLEAQAAASLNHPHIVPVFATGSADGMAFYAMRFIDGRDLAQVIREQRRDDLGDTDADRREPATPSPLSTQRTSHAREVARLARQAAEALDHAHANDVVHRDIKPSNLMIDGKGELWITDFGLARVKGGLDLTHTGEALGTPRYMSPEQALGTRTPLDGRTDIYSLGATIYELLTMRPAFPGADRLEVLRQIAQDEPTPPRKLEPTIPVDLETIVLKAMAKSPTDRFSTAAELAADLGRFLDNRSILARRPSLADQGAKWIKRHRGLMATTTAVLVVLVFAIAGAVLQYTAWLKRHNVALQAEVERADKYAAESQRHASEADRQRRLADRHAFAARVRLAQQAIDARHFEVAQDLLDASAPDPATGDSGEFAWRYLRRLARRELVRLPERAARLDSTALAGDGKTVAALYSDSTIVLWDLASERPSRTIEAVNCRNLALSEDGRTLAAEQRTRDDVPFDQITVWDTTTGRIRGRYSTDPAFRGRPSEPHVLANGRVVASRISTADFMHSVRTYGVNMNASQVESTPGAILDGLEAVVFFPAADFFLTREGARLRVRDALTGAIRRELAGTNEGIGTTIAGSGGYLATTLGRDTVVVLEVATGAERARRHFGVELAVVQLSPEGNAVAGVDWKGRAQVWDWRKGRSREIKPDSLAHGGEPHTPVFSPDGGRIATGSLSSTGGRQPVAVWDCASGRCLGLLPYANGTAQLLSFTGTSRSLILSGNRSPLIWHFDPTPDSPSPAGHKDEAWAVAYSPDGKILATGSDDTDEPQTIKLWDPATGMLIRGWNAGVGTVASLAFSPNGGRLASAHLTQGNNVRLWDIETGRLLRSLRGHRDYVRSIAFSPDGRRLASAGGTNSEASQDWRVHVWDVATASSVHVLPGHTDVVRSLAFSPDGRTLATASDDQTVRLWDPENGRLLQTKRHATDLISVAFAPDGRTLATAEDTGMVTIRDAFTLEVLRTIRGESDKLLNLAMAPDGGSLSTCGVSGTIRLWDTLTGQELLVLKGHKAQVNGIAFAPDSSSLASCSHGGDVKLWRARPTQPR
jgi:WD40 repeat protein